MRTRHPDLQRILAAVRLARPGPVLVMGRVDCGKTTLVRQMANALAARAPVWVVAADTGQAWIGPPATLSRARLVQPRKRWSSLKPQRMICVGATSPAPCLRATAAALVRLAREGVPGAARVVVDTPGLVTGPLAEALWGRVAGGLRPALVVAVEKAKEPAGRAAGAQTHRAQRHNRELAPVLALFRAAGARVLTVRPHPLVRRRSLAARAAYRAAAYRRYFKRAAVRFLDGGLPVESACSGCPAALDVGRLVGLRDAGGWDLALGIVRGIGARRMAMLTPLADMAAVASLASGLLRLEPATGAETSDL